jgi:tetratricopeptide (TPR) repeat protein
MTREQMERELQTLQAILKAEPDASRKPLTALRLAKIAKAAGDWRTAIRALSPYAGIHGARGGEVRLELGNALCRASRDNPGSAAYRRGQRILSEVAKPDEIDISAAAPLAVRVDQRRARALFQLAWSYRDVPGKEAVARKLYYKAFLCDPHDPCHLSAFLEYEVCCGMGLEAPQLMRPQMIEAIETCGRHAESRLELPWLFYSAGMLNLLLGRPYESLAAYARAVELSNNEFPIQQALGSIERLRRSVGTALQGIEWVGRFLILANAAKLMRLSHGSVKEIRQSEDRLSAAARKLEAALAVIPSSPDAVDAARKERSAVAAAFRKARLEADTASRKAAKAIESVKQLATKGVRAMRAPVLYVAGGCDPSVSQEMRKYSSCVEAALEEFAGTAFSGGTTAGVPGLVGEISASLKKAGRRGYTLVGYLPGPGPKGAVADRRRYDQLHRTRGKDFTAMEPLQNWTDIIACGVRPGEVRVLGINGGAIAAFEYRLALALGATVGVLESSGRAASAVLPDAFWWPAGRLVRLPKDPMTAKVFADPPRPFPLSDPREAAAEAVHNKYLSQNRHKAKDPTLVEWPYLRSDIQDSNRQQVAYAERVLRCAGYGVRETYEEPPPIEFSLAEVEAMSEMEHGRWNAERLSAGWSYAPQRDPEQKKSPYLVAWKVLPEEIKQWDRDTIRNFPKVFEKAHMEIYRLNTKKGTNRSKLGRASGPRKPARKPRK